MENTGPEISNFSHTIPNYYRHSAQIITRKSLTGRGTALVFVSMVYRIFFDIISSESNIKYIDFCGSQL